VEIGVKVLIVDGNIDDRTVLIGNLASAGYGSVGVGTAREARKALQRHSFEVVLLDTILPDAKGLALCNEIREHFEERPVIIFISSSNTRADCTTALELGADDFVRKPIVVEELLARMEAHLRRSAHATELRDR
jgi:DNA-binding response OmpR family regulator